MKLFIVTLVIAVAASGCANTAPTAPTFSWYNPMGGEYLFAFDADECKTQVLEQGRQLGTDTQGPFFQCMHARGYYLVDANGIVQEPTSPVLADGPQVTRQ